MFQLNSSYFSRYFSKQTGSNEMANANAMAQANIKSKPTTSAKANEYSNKVTQLYPSGQFSKYVARFEKKLRA